MPYFDDKKVALVYGNCWIVDQRKKKQFIYIVKRNYQVDLFQKELLRTTQYVWDLSLLRKAYLKENCLMIIII